jgi:uncharacterized membrane protein
MGLALGAISFSVFSTPIHATSKKSYTIPQVQIQAEVKPNGSMAVTETRDYDFSGDYRFAYRDFILTPDQTKALGRTEPYSFSQFKVCEQNVCYRELPPSQVNWQDPRSNPPGTFTVSRESNQIRVQWHFVADSTTRRFRLMYMVGNAVTQQTDTSELYWQWIGRDWTVTQSDITAQLTLPPGIAGEKLQAWAHGPLTGRVAIPSATQVVFTLPKLNGGQFFEGRVVWPKGVVKGGAIGTSQLSAIQAQETEFIAQTEAQRHLYEEYLTALLVTAWVFTGALLLSFSWQAWRFWHIHKDRMLPWFLLSSQGEWEPPSDLDPAQVDQLFSLQDKLQPQAFTALVLSLVQRRFYKLRRSATKQGWFWPDFR